MRNFTRKHIACSLWLVLVGMLVLGTVATTAQEVTTPAAEVSATEPGQGVDDSQGAAATPGADTSEVGTSTPVIDPDLIGQWEQMGKLFFEVVDQRVAIALEENADVLIQEKVDAAMATYEDRLAQIDQSVKTDLGQFRTDLEELQKSLEELKTLVLAHDQQIADLDVKLVSLIEELKKEVSDSDSSLRTELEKAQALTEQQNQEIAKLQGATRSLNTRMWITTGAAVLGIVLALVSK